MQNRLTHLREIMKQAGVDSFLICSTSNIFYLSGFNRFLVEHDGYLLVTPTDSYLITSPLYTEAVKKYTPDLSILETSGDIWYGQHIKKIVDTENLKTIGFEETDLRVSEFLDLEEQKLTLKSVSLRYLRAQKEKEEIEKIKKASEITDKTFEAIIQYVKENVTELALSEKMSEIIKSLGGEVGFPTIVAFGPHSSVPHHMTSSEKLFKNSFILFDFGARYEGYVSDMSRTIFFGKPTNEQIKLYETVRAAQEKAMEYISSQLLVDSSQKEKSSTINNEQITNNQALLYGKDVDQIARDIIHKENFVSYPHALGHGVGLEVHEAPTLSAYSKEQLSENTVFTIEPGIYQAGLGGVRIEDVYTIQDNKLEQLTNSSKDLIVI